MNAVFDVIDREAPEIRESPYGSVGVLHVGRDLKAWWIWKDREEIEPTWKIFSREDFLYVIQGQLKLEFRDEPERSVVLGRGESFVIPPGAAFRGYRFPCDSEEPCLFVAVSPADQEDRREPVLG